MSSFTTWKNFFRFSTDVLEEDYVYDHNYRIKTKMQTADKTTNYGLKVEQSKPGDDGECKNTHALKYKFSDKGITQKGKLKNNGKITVKTEIDLGITNENLEGWSYHIDASLVNKETFDKAKFSSAFTYKLANMEAKMIWDHGKSGTVDHVFSFKPTDDNNLVIGGQTTFDYKKTNLTHYAFGFLGKLTDTFSYGVKNTGKEGERFGNWTFYTLQELNKNTQIASSIGYSLKSKDLTVAAGFSHTCRFHHSIWKGKVTSDGLLGLSWKHSFGNGTTLTLSSALDLGDKAILHSTPHPFGVSLEGKF